jgi:hypothetical protein
MMLYQYKRMLRVAWEPAAEHGACRTAQALRLDYSKLMRQMG